MKVNSRVMTERVDMLGEIKITNCPSQICAVAENIIMMATKPGYSISDYHTVTQLDKLLMVDYWKEYDGLVGDFRDWFVRNATAPELIRRARQWLTEHNYLILKSDVAERAYEAGTKFSRAIKS